MCFYYAITKKNPTSLIKNNVIKEVQLKLFDERNFINGFSFDKLPVITSDNLDEIQLFHWGLIPSFVKTKQEAEDYRRFTLNAKSETIFEKKSYNQSIKERRCLVLCSGFYEWQDEKGKKYPYFISLKNDDIFVFAGIWDVWTDKESGEIIQSFSVITVEANELMAKIHNKKKRMPLILPPEKANQWLKKDLTLSEIKDFFMPFQASQMKAHTIQKIIPSNPQNNSNLDIQAFYYYPELVKVTEKHKSQQETRSLFDN